MRKFIRIAVPLSLAIGVVVAGFALYLGFQDNSQNEFFDIQTGSVEVWHSVEFFIIAATGAGGAAFVLFGIVALLGVLLRAATKRIFAGDTR